MFKPEHGYEPSNKDRIDKSLTANYEGTYAEAIPEYLKAYGIRCNYRRQFGSRDDELLEATTSQRPAILKGFKSTIRASHFVVLDGENGKELVICDPAGLVSTGTTNNFDSKWLTYNGIDFNIDEVITTHDPPPYH